MKMNPNSPKHQASIRRWNTYQARKRLKRKVQTCFAPDSRFYTLPLDLHRFKLTPDLLFWHWRGAYRPSADRPGTRYTQKQKGICLFASARSV